MSTKINLEYKNKEYTLEYSRNSVRQMEEQGFVLDQLSEKPMTMIPMLVYGAFAKHHRGIKRSEMDEIYEHITDKVGEDGNSFINVLLEMYAETVTTLTDNKSADEGNRAVWKVMKG